MKPYFIFLLSCISMIRSNSSVAQVKLEFEKDGSLRTDILAPAYKPGGFQFVVRDPDAMQPASQYQTLIATYSRGLLVPFSDATKNDVNFPYKANQDKLVFSPATATSPAIHKVTKTIATSGEFPLKITKPIIDNFILKKHFEDNAVRNSYHGFLTYLPAYDSLKVIYDQYATHIDRLSLQDTILRSRTNTIELGLYLDSIQTVQYELINLVELVKRKNAGWLTNWKWLTEGKEMLNPFYPNVSFLEKKVDDELISQQELMNLVRNRLGLFSITDAYGEFKALKIAVDGLMHNIQLLTKEKASLQAIKEKNTSWLATIKTTETTLNTFKIYLSDPNATTPIVWMQHKDALRNYVSMNAGQIPNAVYEDDQMMAYVHNLKPSQTVKAVEKVDSIALTTTTEDALKDPFAALSTARKSSASILSLLAGLKSVGLSLVGKSLGNKLNSDELLASAIGSESKTTLLDNSRTTSRTPFVAMPYDVTQHQYLYGSEKAYLVSQRFFLKELRKQLIEKFTMNTPSKPDLLVGINTSNPNNVIKEIDVALDKIELRLLALLNVDPYLAEYEQKKPIVQWLALQTPPPFEEIETAFANPAQTTKYRSENVLTGESRSAKGSNAISYTLTQTEGEKTAVVAKDGYKTYKTIRFWPTLGINYVFGSRAAAVFSDSASGFKTKTDIDNFEAVVGVKIYLSKKNITTLPATRKMIQNFGKDNQLRGNNFLSSTFVHVGLGMSHNFLKNYFFGLGFDLFPGVSVQAGGNLYFRKGYELQNGQIKDSVDKGKLAGYVGIYLDPTLVTRLIQLF